VGFLKLMLSSFAKGLLRVVMSWLIIRNDSTVSFTLKINLSRLSPRRPKNVLKDKVLYAPQVEGLFKRKSDATPVLRSMIPEIP